MPKRPSRPPATSAIAATDMPRRAALALAGAAAAAAFAPPAKAQPAAALEGFIAIPGWFSFENQDVGIAVTDLPATGAQQHLVVLMVDAGPQANRGVYRLGKALDANGAVTGGWTPWVDVPDWFPWENQGAGVAVTPPNAQGLRDLVVLMVDNGPEGNRGLYRIGKALDANGAVTGGWTPWVDVPDWFPWENAGAGIAVLPPGGGGAPGLVAFQIDSAPVTAAGGHNAGFFRVGTGLAANGAVGAWQQQWLGVPHWFSWENQGGAVAVATIGGRRRLFVLMADSPAGQNGGFYQMVDLDPDPALQGRWETLAFPSKVLPVHAATLPGGNVLFFAGSGGSEHRFNDGTFGDIAAGAAISVVWTPPGDTFVHPPTLDAADGKPYDLFCGGDAFLPDGRMLSVGGTIDYGPFNGRKEVAAFDPASRTWSFVAPLAQARWYPAVITLGDGRVLAASGLNEPEKKSIEIYDATTNAWQTRAVPGNGLPLYAHLFGMADGRVCFSGGRMDDGVESGPCIIDLGQNPVALTPIGGLAAPGHRNQATSVLLGPAQEQRVMVCGGGPNPRTNMTPATGAVGIVNLGAANPTYAAAAPMALPRMHHNAVLLPDRTVFVTGGSLQQESAPLARMQPELYDPAANTWRTMAMATVPRLYHATALLLADGRVVAAGSNPNAGHTTVWLPDVPDPNEEMRLEIFSPPYLFRGPRPTIANAPDQCAYGQTVTVTTPQAANIRWASLMRNCVTTHSFDGSQRLVDLPIASRGAGTINVAVPNNRNLAPPGWYMLFLVDQQGVPSVAHWTRLG